MPSVSTVPVVCQHCQTVFLAVAYKVKIGQAKFCSKACLDVAKIIPEADRFWSKVAPPDSNGCRLWIGQLDQDGYGRFFLCTTRKNIPASRYSLQLKIGRPVLSDKFACHVRECASRRCVSPDHLYEGTPLENSADMVALGHQVYGERNRWARLTESDVRAIRARKGERGNRQQIAEDFKVSIHSINGIMCGKIWRLVK